MKSTNEAKKGKIMRIIKSGEHPTISNFTKTTSELVAVKEEEQQCRNRAGLNLLF